MKEKQKVRNAKGITLVALVVTIIVLIILAGVSISLILGENGIITKAKYTQQETLNSQIEEQEQLNEVEIYLDELGENSGSTIAEISLNDLKVGDYIKYNTGVEGVGEITCRVLYEASSKYGLQIISNENITKTVDGVEKEIQVDLGGDDWDTAKESYNAAIKTLNNEAEKYINEDYVVDARCVGSLPTVDDGVFTQKDSGTEATVDIAEDWTLPTGWTSTDTGCHDTDTNYETDKTAMEAANIWITGGNYWLASRYVISESSHEAFYGHYVGTSGSLNYYYLCSVNNDGSTDARLRTLGIRPCFSLKSDIKITGGNGTSSEKAYIIQ